MKVIIATGIFPPDIGGPAIYVEKLAQELENKGINVKVITYSDNGINSNYQRSYNFPVVRISRNYPLLIRYFLYFWNLLKIAKDADIIYAQDLFSSGLPAVLVKKILRKKLVIRLGGDFLCEKAITKRWFKGSLSTYYKQPKNILEKLFLKIAQYGLKRTDIIVFSTSWQKNIYLENYKISQDKIRIIENPFPDVKNQKTKKITETVNNKIIFAGRLIKLKNIDFLINAFSQVIIEYPDLKLEIIGNGPEKKHLKRLVRKLNLKNNVNFEKGLPSKKLTEKIRKCFLVIIPSLFEISPNLVLECIKLRKPVLLTKETGFYQKFKNKLIFIDPFDQKDLENKIKYLLNQKNYQNYIKKISSISTNYSWDKVTEKHLNIFQQLIK